MMYRIADNNLVSIPDVDCSHLVYLPNYCNIGPLGDFIDAMSRQIQAIQDRNNPIYYECWNVIL